MSFEILPASSDDGPAFAGICLAAFSSPNYPHLLPLMPDVREWRIAMFKQRVDQSLRRDNPCRPVILKAWSFAHDNTTKEKERAATSPSVNDALKAAIRKRQEIMGPRPRLYGDMLAVHPSHAHQGVGLELLRWALVYADTRGLDVYLPATPVAKRN
ncbi:hypothetical protein ETB97_000879 [Aspergillus alliaceus]|uniref:N-acetyltransferase domain-containing protein n=1 Tax=Petromyces alliaceus TaxID=209559 RepID=A0A8H6E687_PETAA|nr:hypothetical protein ETB97_000879 [Aspergillus burnettii]